MDPNARILAAVITFLAANSHPTLAQTAALNVQLRNDAKVADDILKGARRLARDIYLEAGIALNWVDEHPVITVILRPRASQETARRAQNAMGYTPNSGELRGRLAYVLMDRVNRVAADYGSPTPVVLAVAIAHELGHLLTLREHSTTGLMKPYFNQSDFRKARQGELLLSPEQAQRAQNAARGVVDR